jgi:hypothetical protein
MLSPHDVRQLEADLGAAGLKTLARRGDETASLVARALDLATATDSGRDLVIGLLRQPASDLPAAGLRRGLGELSAFMEQYPGSLTGDLVTRAQQAVEHSDITTLRAELRNAADIAEGRVPRLLLPGQQVRLPSGGEVRRMQDGGTFIRDALGPGMQRQDFEQRMLPAVDVGLDGWHRAHSQGAGTGAESPAGILYAPPEVNLEFQASGIERHLRDLVRQKASDVTFHLETTTLAHPGTRRLASIQYRLVAERGGKPTRMWEASLTVQDRRDAPRVTIDVEPLSDAEPFLK